MRRGPVPTNVVEQLLSNVSRNVEEVQYVTLCGHCVVSTRCGTVVAVEFEGTFGL